MRLAILSAAAFSAVTALSACAPHPMGGDYFASNRMRVVPQGADQFEVQWLGGPQNGIADYWCAAGEYVSRYLGKPPATMIYRLTPAKRARGEGLTFSLNPKGAQPSGLMRFGNSGPGFTAGGAEGSFCGRVPPTNLLDL